MIKENSDLENDHSQGCLLLNRINNGLKKELLSGEIINNYITDEKSNTKNNFRKSLRSIKGIDDKDKPFEVKEDSLCKLVSELEKLVDASKTKLSLLDEESTFFRHRY